MNYQSTFLAIALMSAGAYANTAVKTTSQASKEATKITAPSYTGKQALSSRSGVKHTSAPSAKDKKKN